MRPELEEKLFAKHPDLFSERHLPVTHTCMCWGVECGDGWYSLLERLCDKIENVFQEEPDLRKTFKVVQVKEKYGTLRFYTNYLHDKISPFIREAEDESAITCEICGAPGSQNTSGWISTMCEKCRDGMLK